MIYESIVDHTGKNLMVSADETMTYRGRQHIKDYLESVYRNKCIDSQITYREFEDTIEKISMSVSRVGEELKTKQGKWTTRLFKDLKSFGIRLSAEELGRVGDLVTRYTGRLGPWYLDFTTDLNWNNGSFGDKESCFWASRSDNRDSLILHKALAVRLYRSDTYISGCGRAWIGKPYDEDFVVMFNAYGESLDRFSYLIQRLYSSENINVFCEKRELINRPDDNFWINGGQGVVISFDKIPNERVDLNYCRTYGIHAWKFDKGDYPTCHKCGEMVYPTLENPVITSDTIIYLTEETHSGYIYCDKCKQDHGGLTFCSHCRAYHPDHEFVVDLKGHKCCLRSGTYVLLCSYGHNYAVSAMDLIRNGKSPEEYLSLSHCHIHKINRPYTHMYGVVCPDCYTEIRHTFTFNNWRRVKKSNYLRQFAQEYTNG
jgi:hypothetical protein